MAKGNIAYLKNYQSQTIGFLMEIMFYYKTKPQTRFISSTTLHENICL